MQLENGNLYCWQWDTKQRLIIEEINESLNNYIYIGNPKDKVGLYKMEIYDESGVLYCDIPDEILQFAGTANIYLSEISADKINTTAFWRFTIREREKPMDYVFYPTEQITIEMIMEELKKTQDMVDPNTIQEEIHNYFVENPLSEQELDPVATRAIEKHNIDENAHNNILKNKVDKVTGKQLSTNDFSNDYKLKLDNAVLYQNQELTNEQKAQARANIGAMSVNEQIPSIEGLVTKNYVDEQLIKKVDKEDNKGLSTNDFTNSEKVKLAGIETGAQVNVQADWNQQVDNADYIRNKTHWVNYKKSEKIFQFKLQEGFLEETILDTVIDLQDKQGYVVTHNEKDYYVAAREIDYLGVKYLCLGDISWIGFSGEGNDCPFTIVEDKKEKRVSITSSDGADLSIFTCLEDIHKLDEKYIPDSLKNIQANYEQYDNTKPDYIKNRLAYQDYGNIVYDYGKEDVTLPFEVNTLQDAVGLKVVDKNKGRRMAISPKKKLLNEVDLLIDGQNLRIAYTSYGGYLSKPCICMMGNEMYRICPSFFTKNNNKYNALFYAFEEVTDNLGLGLTFNQGWHAINTTNFSNEEFDINQNPIIISDNYFTEYGKYKSYLTDLFPLREEIEYTITEDNIAFSDDILIVSFFKISDIDLNISEENVEYFHRIFSFIFDIDNNQITTSLIGSFYDELWYKNITIIYPTEIHQINEKFIPDFIPKIQSAEIGQTLVVKAIDENGKPTKWETINSIKIDAQLSSSGQAADAKVVGDALSEKQPKGDYALKSDIIKELPMVSASDDGKFLRVVAGQWAAQTIPNAEEARF